VPIYTRTGDKGKTSLFGGKRVLKSDVRVDTYGTIDELNSVIGLVIANMQTKHKKIAHELEKIQHDLFAIGAYLANPKAQASKNLSERVKEFEKMIDIQTKKMPELKNFILPGGGMTGAELHQARTVARRAERQLVALMQKEILDEKVITYINRLSDLLFSTARFVNHNEKKKETIWKQS
jgi:cob(I)alamin adenosyltransferase